MIKVTYRVNIPWMPAQKGDVNLAGPPTVKELLRNIGFEEDQYHNVLVAVNGKNRLPGDFLEEGDLVVILPALCGG